MDSGATDARPDAATATQRLRGVTPAQQVRSEATFQALIKAGRKALDNKSFDEMTIEDIARAAGASVGAFYGRFKNKEAFFSAIQEITIGGIEGRLRIYLTDPVIEAGADVEFLAAVARFSVGVFRKHRGLYTASFKHCSTRPGAWSPIRRLGHNVSGLIAERLVPRLRKVGKPATERDVRVGMQFVNGLLVNAVLNDPGPLSLDDKEIEEYITQFLCSFFNIHNGGKTRRGKPQCGSCGARAGALPPRQSVAATGRRTR